MNYEMHDLLNLMVQSKASDLHIRVGIPPTMRIHGEILPVDGPPLNPADTETLISSIASKSDLDTLKARGDADFSISYMNQSRFRISLLKSKGDLGMVLRQIPDKILALEEIGFPASIKDILKRPRGLILITGPTGCGKTTTLASMINWINSNIKGHIITIEDPIEYVFTHNKSIITQKEVGSDVLDFAGALRGSLRQDPNVILVGEMRDLETIKAAISAAETGHLVFGSVHTTSAGRTVDRIIDVFPADTRDEIRNQLASTILAVISQTLMKSTKNGRIAAFEIMVHTDAISALIRDDKSHRIISEIQTGSKFGMITLDDHIKSLLSQGLIFPDQAIEKSHYPEEMKLFINKLTSLQK